MNNVKADTYNINIYNYDTSLSFCGNGGCNLSLNDSYNQLINIYNQNYKSNYDSYYIRIISDNYNHYLLSLNYFNSSDMTYVYDSSGLGVSLNESIHHFITYDSNTLSYKNYSGSGYNLYLIGDNSYLYFDSSFDWFIGIHNYIISGFYDNDSINLDIGNKIPKAKDLFSYSSWSDYNSNLGLTSVDLDNYEYAILSLKNYNTDPFNTTFYVKGRIGITPVYNYGQSEKDTITDICNISYSDYTPLRVYALEQDIQNHAVYYVKACESGSAFKFDSTLFNITYVTQENLSDPTVTINGSTYHTLPFNSLTNTANQNDENGFVPGEVTPGTGGLDSAIQNVQNKMSEIWGTFTYFTSFINQLFATLPVELRTVLISAFTIAIILGLIKIFAL